MNLEYMHPCRCPNPTGRVADVQRGGSVAVERSVIWLGYFRRAICFDCISNAFAFEDSGTKFWEEVSQSFSSSTTSFDIEASDLLCQSYIACMHECDVFATWLSFLKEI